MVWTSKRKSVWAQMVIYSSSLYKSGRGQPINRCIWVRNTSSQHAQMWTPIFHLKTELLHNSHWPSPVITNLFTLGFWKSLANTWLLLAERLFFQSSFMAQECLSSGFGVFFSLFSNIIIQHLKPLHEKSIFETPFPSEHTQVPHSFQGASTFIIIKG